MIEQTYKSLPQLSDGKVALLFTGGVESYLLATLLLKKYGKDNVVLMSLLMKEYNVFGKYPEKAERVLNDFNAATKKLQAVHTHLLTSAAISKFQGTLPERVLQSMYEVFPDVKYTFDGYNNIHKESLDIFYKTNFNEHEKYGVKQARLYLATHQHEYPELYDFVFKCEGIIYFVQDDYKLKTREDVTTQQSSTHFSPLLNYTKAQVIKMYEEAGLLDELYNTKSCSSYHVHCGQCSNCLNRMFAFKQSGVEDKTFYADI